MSKFSVGSVVMADEQKLTVMSIRPEAFQIVLEGSVGDQYLMSIDEFNNRIAIGRYRLAERKGAMAWSLLPARYISEIERNALNHRLKLLHVVTQMRSEQKTWNETADAVATYCLENNVAGRHARTLQRWLEQFNDSISAAPESLAPNFSARGNKCSIKTNDDLEFFAAIDDEIFRRYCTTDKFNISDVVILVNQRLRKYSQETGAVFRGHSRRSVKRRIDLISVKLGLAGRFDKKTFDQEMRVAIQHIFVARPYERVEADATPLDIFVIDKKGVIIGKACVYAAVDVATRSCIGISVTLSKPSQDTVLKMLEFCFSPKGDDFTEKYNLRNSWLSPAGIESIALDNAAEHHGGLVLSAMRYLNTVIDYPQAGKPQFRPVIERFFGTLKTGLINSLSGSTTSQSSLVKNSLKKAMSQNLYTLPELEALIIRWVSDVYMQTPTNSLQNRFEQRCSPAQAMEMLKRQYPILPPPHPALFREACMRYKAKDVRLRRDGIHCEGLPFQSEELAALYQDIGDGHSVQVCYYPLDCTSVLVIDPRDAQNRITAFNKIRNMPIMSFDDAKTVRQEHYRSDAQLSAEPYHQAKAELLIEAQNKLESKKLGTRNQGARKAEQAERAQSLHTPKPHEAMPVSAASHQPPLTAAPRRPKGEPV